MTSRRTFLAAATTTLTTAAAALTVGGLLPLSRAAMAATATQRTALDAALQSSDLVYLTPLHKNGKESRCHAEVWFVQKSGVVYVVTANNAWRAKALGRGLQRAQLWVGDFGNWKSAGDRFRTAPGFMATGTRITDQKEIASVLDLYSNKYRIQWLLWSSKFHNGLRDGTRVMLRYTREA